MGKRGQGRRERRAGRRRGKEGGEKKIGKGRRKEKGRKRGQIHSLLILQTTFPTFHFVSDAKESAYDQLAGYVPSQATLSKDVKKTHSYNGRVRRPTDAVHADRCLAPSATRTRQSPPAACSRLCAPAPTESTRPARGYFHPWRLLPSPRPSLLILNSARGTEGLVAGIISHRRAEGAS